jgi:hypothetical protein
MAFSAATSDLSNPNEPNVRKGQAFGHPGIAPTWTSSAKDVVGCSLGPSRVWFTIGFGIVNEVYYPRVDLPQLRDVGFIVADGRGFWVEVKRLESYSVELLAPGTPAVKIVHRHERFTLTLRIVVDQDRDVLAIETTLEGDPRVATVRDRRTAARRNRTGQSSNGTKARPPSFAWGQAGCFRARSGRRRWRPTRRIRTGKRGIRRPKRRLARL